MSPNLVLADTPYYVLRDGNHRIGPHMAQPDSDPACAPIYAFSAAGAYHQFRKNSAQPLTPYPLVKVYLRARAGEVGDTPKLVAIDAAGPCAPRVQAATIDEVLKAHESGTSHVSTAYHLIFDEQAAAYRVETASA